MSKESIDVVIAKSYTQRAFNAGQRGIDFELSFNDFKSIVSQQTCFFTGIKLTEKTFSIYRIDSKKGYTKDNCVACFRPFNTLKGGLENDTNVMTIDMVAKGLKKAHDLISVMARKPEIHIAAKNELKNNSKYKGRVSRLSCEDISLILSSNAKLKDIAQSFGVSISRISQIKNNKQYQSGR